MVPRPPIAALLAAGLTFASAARADSSLSYQGRITDGKGAGVPSAELTAHLFDTAAATTPAVTLGPFNNVVFRDGVFSLSLGLSEAQLDTLFGAGKRAHIQIIAKLPDGKSITLPRQELGASPLALRIPTGAGLRFDGDGKLVVDLDDSLLPAGIARDSEIPSLTAPGAFGEVTPSTVKATELRLPDADGTVVTVKANAATPSDYALTLPVNDGANGEVLVTDGNGNLSWGSVSGLGPNTVGTTEISNNAVTNAKVADNAITNSKLADNAVNTAEVADNAITNPKLADNAVNTAEVADNAITNSKLADNAVNTAEVADDAITNSKLADNAVNTAEIADDAVTADKLAPNAVTGAAIDPTSNLAVANATANSTLRIKEAGVGTDYTIFSGGTQSGDINYTLPPAVAAADGYVLSSTDDGILSWEPLPAAGVAGVASTANANAVTIDANERVSIGLGITPLDQLHVDYKSSAAISTGANTGTTNVGLTVRNTDPAATHVGLHLLTRDASQNSAVIGLAHGSSFNDGSIFFRIRDGAGSSREVMRLQADGDVEIAGQLKIAGGTPGIGKILTSDGAGLATWESPTGVVGISSAADANSITIDANERVGIGTGTPLSTLDVAGGLAVGSYAGTTAAPANGLAVSGSVLVGLTSGLGIGTLSVNSAISAGFGAQYFNLVGTDGGEGERPAGTMLRPSTGYSLNLVAGAGAGDKVGLYYAGAGVMRSAVEVATTASAAGDLLLMRTGGNVGIGTAAPTATLQVSNTLFLEDVALRFGANNSNTVSKVGSIYSTSGQSLKLFSNSGIDIGNNSETVVASIAGNAGGASYFNAGNVGIGTTTPAALLELKPSSGTGLLVTNQPNERFIDLRKIDGSELLSTSYSGTTIELRRAANVVHTSVGGPWSTVFDGETIVQATAFARHSNLGGYGYATVGTPLTSTRAELDTFAWNGTDGSTLGTRNVIRSTQLSAANGDARLDVEAPSSTPRISVLSSNGNVGIGVSDPDARLEINGQIKITGGTPGIGKILTSDGAGLATWETPGGVPGIVSTANATAVTIDASEKVGIGTTTPDELLDIEGGDVRIWNNFDAKIYLGNAGMIRYGNGADILYVGSEDEYRHVSIGNAGAGVSAIFVDRLIDGGHVGIGTTSPNARLDVFRDSPAANEIVFNVGTSADTNRFYVDAEGDVYQDGSLLIQDDNSYVRTTRLRSNIEMTLDIDSNNNVTTDYFAITHNGGLAELMRVQENGNVGIGSTDPQSKLEVNGTIHSKAGGIKFPDGTVQMTSATSGTNNSMLANFPDVLRCTAPASIAVGKVTFFMTDSDRTDGVYRVLYRSTVGYTAWLNFNSDGTYESSSGLGVTSDCYNQSMTQNYGAGRAFNFAKGPAAQWLQSGGDAYYNAGKVGIGTSSPTTLLDLYQSQNASTAITVKNDNAGATASAAVSFTTDGGSLAVGKTSDAGGGHASVWNSDDTALTFGTNATERMRIEASGDVGIGTTTPTAKLDVNGRIKSTMARSQHATSATWSTTSTTWVDTDHVITVTTTGGPVLLNLSAIGATDTAGGIIALRFTVDGTPVTAAAYGNTMYQNSPGETAYHQKPLSAQWLVTSLAAGSHTFRVQARVNVGTVTGILAEAAEPTARAFIVIEL